MERKAFCFCTGKLVDCIPGRVQDCNMKNVSKCPLEEERAKNKAFCFCKGELVDCIPGRVQDCNMKNVSKCPLEEEHIQKVKEIIEKQKQNTIKQNKKAFCFCKGELVDCIPGRVQDCNMKNVSKCPLEEEKQQKGKEKQQGKEKGKKKEKEKRSFCFCKGELVDCIPGRVQDCNMKNVSKCPLDK